MKPLLYQLSYVGADFLMILPNMNATVLCHVPGVYRVGVAGQGTAVHLERTVATTPTAPRERALASAAAAA